MRTAANITTGAATVQKIGRVCGFSKDLSQRAASPRTLCCGKTASLPWNGDRTCGISHRGL